MNLFARKIPTLLGLLLLVGVVAGIIYYFQGQKKAVSEDVVPQKVRITNVADNKFAVSWVTTRSTRGAVVYGAVGEKLNLRAHDERDSGQTTTAHQTHHVVVEGLQPNTQYAFRIVSGEQESLFDNNGSPYTVTTGPVIAGTPVSKNLYGAVELPSKQTAEGTIVYVSLPGGATASTLVSEVGNYALTLSTMRTSDLRSYVQFDPAATVATLTIESGQQQSTVTVSLANAEPVPKITLGQNADFRNLAGVEQKPAVAEVVPQPETPSIFNVEPLQAENDINVVNTTTVSIVNPGTNGEVLATLRPEFRGMGPKATTLSIVIKGQKAVSETVVIENDGTWTFAPTTDLKIGRQTLTVSYIGAGGAEQKVEREFVIVAPTGGEVAFVATPSASKKATPSPSALVASPRAAMPATDSGVPVTGVVEYTIFMLVIGLGLVMAGILFL